MKKIYVLVFVLIFYAFSPAYSEENGSFEFSLGLKGVTGAGFFLGKGWEHELSRYGLDNNPVITFGGIFLLDMNLARAGAFNFGIQPEALFCKTGGLASIDSDDFDYYSLWIADISLYLKPGARTEKCDVFILIGPSVCMPLTDIDGTYSYNDHKIDDDIRPDYDYCIGMGAGIGVDIPMGIGKLEIALVYKTYFTSYRDDYDLLQNMVILSLGYSFTVVK
ncbi:MAG TPA: hypothetical protein PK926_15780 [Spirochaetota bacterium]|nr:hypothetical protein [Spirochaetota bacterium]HPI89332.1 hypothetical protein [Spirochaetota bacterium]HPR48322.1 hypothetical protein [Spirochaetota bacterium]